jgi:betaine-aldehyde dehydrogenase
LEALSLGPACNPEIDMGPVITQAHRDRVHGHIRDGLDSGADLITGGLDDPRIPDRGHFVAPTLFDRAGPDARLVREEIFGPVMTVQRWSSLDEAVQLANGVEYGLTASIWTSDIQSGLRVADAVEAGYVWVNDSTTHYWGTPFGGWKNSGIGREESLEEYQSYLQTKTVHVKLHP